MTLTVTATMGRRSMLAAVGTLAALSTVATAARAQESAVTAEGLDGVVFSPMGHDLASGQALRWARTSLHHRPLGITEVVFDGARS